MKISKAYIRLVLKKKTTSQSEHCIRPLQGTDWIKKPSQSGHCIRPLQGTDWIKNSSQSGHCIGSIQGTDWIILKNEYKIQQKVTVASFCEILLNAKLS